MGAFHGRGIFSCIDGGISLRGKREHSSGEFFSDHLGIVRRRRNAGRNAELKRLPGGRIAVKKLLRQYFQLIILKKPFTI